MAANRRLSAAGCAVIVRSRAGGAGGGSDVGVLVVAVRGVSLSCYYGWVDAVEPERGDKVAVFTVTPDSPTREDEGR